jgi:hypothetical protein
MPPGWSASGPQLIYTSYFAAADYSQAAFSTDAILAQLNLADFQQLNEYADVRFTIQNTTTGTVTLNHPGGTNVYTNSVDLIGELQTLVIEGAALPGDFNLNGTVDGADYVVWRKNINTPATYNTWRAHFGLTQTTASASGVSPAASIPEPGAILLAAAAGVLFPGCSSRRRRRMASCNV